MSKTENILKRPKILEISIDSLSKYSNQTNLVTYVIQIYI